MNFSLEEFGINFSLKDLKLSHLVNSLFTWMYRVSNGKKRHIGDNLQKDYVFNMKRLLINIEKIHPTI